MSIKIQENTIKNIAKKDEDELFSLSCELSRSCVVDLGASTFEYVLEGNQELDFTVDMLREIYNFSFKNFLTDENIDTDSCIVKNIAGIIKAIDFTKSQDLVKEAFGHELMYLVSEEVQNFYDHFWNEIGKHIVLPPTHVFIHEASCDTVFAEGVFWNFCFICLDNNAKKGIVFYGWASD